MALNGHVIIHRRNPQMIIAISKTTIINNTITGRKYMKTTRKSIAIEIISNVTGSTDPTTFPNSAITLPHIKDLSYLYH